MNIKIEQIAFGTANPEKVIKAYSAIGINDWIHDTVEAEGMVFGKYARNVAELHFNYQLGYELEILNYKSGENWHKYKSYSKPDIFLSHKGVHIETESEIFAIKMELAKLGVIVAQEVFTLSHTNEVIAGKRKYHYVVFDSQNVLGFDLKLIRRIDL